MARTERSESKAEIPPFIAELKRFVEPIQPGQKPLVYIATRQSAMDYLDRDTSRPSLYRTDQLTQDQFISEVYPNREYGDYRDIKKAEEWIMPGFDCYVTPIELSDSALDWSFAGALAKVLEPMINGKGKQIDNAINEVLGIEEPEDENESMLQGVQEHMQTLLPIFQNAGPLDLPHFHANVCFGLDNYAHDWLRMSRLDTHGTDEQDLSPAEIFNKRYGYLGLRYGRMMTIRYSSYKPGRLGAVFSQLSEDAMRELGGEPDVIQQQAAAISESFSKLQEDEEFSKYFSEMQSTGIQHELAIINSYLELLPDNNEYKQQISTMAAQLTSLFDFLNRTDIVAHQHFDEICRQYFNMSEDEFLVAYDAKLKWLDLERDQALIDMAHRLGVSVLIENNSYDSGLFRSLSLEDFPPGGVVLSQNEDQRFDGKPSRMIVAYPVTEPAKDLATISVGQFEGAIDKRNTSSKSNGLVFLKTEPDLHDLRNSYIQSHLKYASQYQLVDIADVRSGQININSVNNSTEVLFISCLDVGQLEKVSQRFIKGAMRKIMRGRRTNVGPLVVVFINEDITNTKWLPENTHIVNFLTGDRDIISTHVTH